jgi:DNA-binding LacI/PurR family transcriptional regulator
MAALRTQGWRAAHAEFGVDVDERLIMEDARYSAANAYAAVRAAIAGGASFDAVFAITDDIAFGVLAGLRSAGKRIPQDVAVVGFDNVSMSQFAVPSLTSIDPNRTWMADQVARALTRRMADPKAEPLHLVTPVELVVRDSTS